jgi:hypothetical protein
MVRLVNLANRLLIVVLNGGQSLYLGPGQTSPPISPAEVNANSKIEKLQRGGLLSIVNVA